MNVRLLQGLLLFPQPLLTVAYLVVVSTYQAPPSLRPVVLLAALPAAALGLEPLAPRPRSVLAIAVGVAELVWAGVAGAVVAAAARTWAGG